MEYQITLCETSGKKVYVDPQEQEGIYLYPGEIRKLKLKDGIRIEEELFEQIRKEYAIPRAKKRALGILAKRDKTEQEIREKLEDSMNDAYSIQEAIDFLKKMGYLNDLTYAREYIYYKKKRKSLRQISFELKKKGISQEILDVVMEESDTDQEEDLREEFLKYARKFPEADAKSKNKIYMHFARKGYDGGLLRSLLSIWEEELDS